MNETPDSNIAEQIIKLFVSYKYKIIKVSYILSKLDLSYFIKESNSQFSPEALLKLYLYKRIKSIKTYKELENRLKQDETEATSLGFNKENNELTIPKKRTFNQFIQENINSTKKEAIAKIAESILSAAYQRKVLLDLDKIKEKIDKALPKSEEQDRITKNAIKLIKKLIYPNINIHIGKNGTYTTRDLLDCLVYTSRGHLYCNGGSAVYNKEYEKTDRKAPKGNDIMYHLKKLKCIDSIELMFDKILGITLSFAKQNYKGFNKRKLDLAIDTTSIAYYGDKNSLFVVEGGNITECRGTTHFFKFITCSIVMAGERFVIAASPVHKFDSLEDLVDKIVSKAKSRVNIDHIYLDRGFDKPAVINVLKGKRVKFVIPKIKSNTVKAWLRKSEDVKSRVIKDFVIGKGENKAVVDLVVVDDKKGVKRSFITNFDIPHQLAHYLYNFYSKRWGIETCYRQLTHDFLVRTTSKNYSLRLFYFLLSVCLFNLWVLVNLCVSLSIYKRIPEKPIITTQMFATILYKVVYDDGG